MAVQEDMSFDCLEDVVKFVVQEITSNTPPARLGLISCILGEIEEKEGQFPLTSCWDTYRRLLEFYKEDLEEKLQKMAKTAWTGRNAIKKKRRYKQKHAHLWHFVNDSACNCLGFATVVVDACRILGIQNVRPIISEIHVWLSFGATAEALEPAFDISKMVEIMTPGKGVGKTVDAKKSLSWCYQRDRWQTWHAQMCDDKDFTAINVINTDLEPAVKLRLLQGVMAACNFFRVPHALVELARCYMEVKDLKQAEQVYKEAVQSSVKYCNNCNVYPHTELGHFYFEHGDMLLALKSYAHAVNVTRRYNCTYLDSDLTKELNQLPKRIAEKIVPKILEGGQMQEGWKFFLCFFDCLFVWFEKSQMRLSSASVDFFKAGVIKFPWTLLKKVPLATHAHKEHKDHVIPEATLPEPPDQMQTSDAAAEDGSQTKKRRIAPTFVAPIAKRRKLEQNSTDEYAALPYIDPEIFERNRKRETEPTTPKQDENDLEFAAVVRSDALRKIMKRFGSVNTQPTKTKIKQSIQEAIESDDVKGKRGNRR